MIKALPPLEDSKKEKMRTFLYKNYRTEENDLNFEKRVNIMIKNGRFDPAVLEKITKSKNSYSQRKKLIEEEVIKNAKRGSVQEGGIASAPDEFKKANGGYYSMGEIYGSTKIPDKEGKDKRQELQSKLKATMDEPNKEITYSQGSGIWVIRTQSGFTISGQGYSGFDLGLNNNKKQGEPNEGPTPLGKWRITQFFKHKEHLGKNVFKLEPQKGNSIEKTKRNPKTFFWHGDNKNGTASTGCIISDYNRIYLLRVGDVINIID